MTVEVFIVNTHTSRIICIAKPQIVSAVSRVFLLMLVEGRGAIAEAEVQPRAPSAFVCTILTNWIEALDHVGTSVRMILTWFPKFRCVWQREQEEQQILFKVPDGFHIPGLPETFGCPAADIVGILRVKLAEILRDNEAVLTDEIPVPIEAKRLRRIIFFHVRTSLVRPASSLTLTIGRYDPRIENGRQSPHRTEIGR